MKLKTKEMVPAGSYVAEFQGVEETEHAEYGPGLLWSFKIKGGAPKFRGQTVGRTTSAEATKKNAAGKFLLAITGKAWDVAKGEDIDDYIGVECQVMVGETDSGATRVESFIPVRQPGEDEVDPSELDAAGEETPFDN